MNLGSFRQCTPPEGSAQEDAPLTFFIWQMEVSVFGVGALKELLMSGKTRLKKTHENGVLAESYLLIGKAVRAICDKPEEE